MDSLQTCGVIIKRIHIQFEVVAQFTVCIHVPSIELAGMDLKHLIYERVNALFSRGSAMVQELLCSYIVYTCILGSQRKDTRLKVFMA